MVAETASVGQPDKFQPLRDAYRRALPQRISEICDSWAGVGRNSDSAANWNTFEHLVHSLVGSAGTFGFQALGEQARELEDFLHNGKNCANSERTAEIERRLTRLRLLAE